MTAATETPRAELVERFVILNALELFLANVVDLAHDVPYGVEDTLPAVDGDHVHLGGFDADHELSPAGLLEKLWPDDDDLDGREYQLVRARSDALVAQLAARLSASSTGLAELAVRFSGLSAKAVAEAGADA